MAVTAGPRVSEFTKRLYDANQYTDYLYLHGLGVEFAEALAELLRDPQLRRQLGEQGQRAVRREFTDDHMAEKMLQLYEELLQWQPASR